MSRNAHVIFGAGLVGGYLAGAFLSQGLSARIIGRANVIKKTRTGLRISALSGQVTLIENVPVYSGEPFDVLWLTVKATAVENALDSLGALINDNTLIICCQNGLGSDQPLRRAFPDNTILNAVVGFNVSETFPQNESQPAHLHRSTDGKLIVEYHPRIEADVQQAHSALLAAHCSRHIGADQWAKLQLNIANPVNALADVPVKSMTESAEFRRIIADLMTELLDVTGALKLELPKVTAVSANRLPAVMRLPNWIFTRIAQKMLAIDPTARTSMWWDLSQGRTTEVGFINGAVVRQAERLGLACPRNRRIVQLVHEVERGERTIGLSATQLRHALDND